MVTKLTTLLAGRQFANAEPFARECLAIREKVLPDHWLTFNARVMLGVSLLGQKKYNDAEPLLLSGYEGMDHCKESIPAEERPQLNEALQRLVQLYEAMARPDHAAEWKKKLTAFNTAETERAAAATAPPCRPSSG